MPGTDTKAGIEGKTAGQCSECGRDLSQRQPIDDLRYKLTQRDGMQRNQWRALVENHPVIHICSVPKPLDNPRYYVFSLECLSCYIKYSLSGG